MDFFKRQVVLPMQWLKWRAFIFYSFQLTWTYGEIFPYACITTNFYQTIKNWTSNWKNENNKSDWQLYGPLQPIYITTFLPPKLLTAGHYIVTDCIGYYIIKGCDPSSLTASVSPFQKLRLFSSKCILSSKKLIQF